MTSHPSNGSEEGTAYHLINFNRSPSISLNSRRSLEHDPNSELSTSTTLARHRSVSPVQNVPKSNAIETSEPSPAILPEKSDAESGRQTARLTAPRDVWAKEILSLALSVGCMVAVFAILISQNGKPLSSWPLPWKPNSVVSFFTTISRAALIFPLASCISQFKWHHFRHGSHQLSDLQLFDSASRGPLGSLSFIFRVSFRSRAIVASLSCILTIAALSMETFVQQTIDYPLRSAQMDHVPSTAKVSQFYGNSSDEVSILRSKMAKAINTGIFGDTATQSLTCPTGNCTWPDLTTVGVCSSCQNVTLETKQECHVDPGTNETIIGMDIVDNYKDNCTYTTPGGAVLTGSNNSTGLGGNTTTLLVMTTPDMITSTDTMYTSTDTTIIKNPMQGRGNHTVPTGVLEVFQCTLRLCARTFSNASVTSGDAWSGVSTRSSNMSVDAHGDIKVYDDPAVTMDGKNYSVGLSEAANLIQTFQTMFSAKLDQHQRVAFASSKNADGEWVQTYHLETPLQEMNYLSYMYNNDDIPQLLDDMALSITEYMRTVNSTDVPGTSFSNVTYVQVHWPWFIGPVLIELSAAILLVAAMIISSHQKHVAGTQVWKDSIFPFLFNGIDRDRLDEIGPGTTDRASEMERRAQQISVRLDRDEADGRLRFA